MDPLLDDDRLYFRQLLAGRDIARDDPVARQMVNFVYLIGDRVTGEAVVVDPAYDVDGILDVAAADGMRLVGRAGHPLPRRPHRRLDDGHELPGRARAARAHRPCPSTCRPTRSPWVQRTTGLTAPS